MKIAFITDQHFSFASRWEETLSIADWCTDCLRDERPDVIALGGDMFDRRPLPEETKAVAEWVQSLARIAPVVGVYGNHDVSESLAVMNRLDAPHRIHIADKPEVLSVAGSGIALIPWPRKAQLLASLGNVPQQHASDVAQDALRCVLMGLRSELDEVAPGGCRVLIGHVMVRGSRASAGNPLIGCDMELGLDDLALAKCSAYLLGHIHLGPGNEWDIGGSPALYGGSFRRTTFGESEEKSVVVLELEPGELARVTRIPIPCTPMHLVETEWAEEHYGIAGVIPAGFATFEDPDARGSEIRFRYHVASEHREAAARAAAELRNRWLTEGAILVKLEPIVEVDTRARAPKVAQARTLPEQLDAYWASKGDVPPRRESIQTKLAELESSVER